MALDLQKNQEMYFGIYIEGEIKTGLAVILKPLWVIQFELDVQGGGIQSGNRGGSYPYERHFGPLLRFAPFNSWPVGDYTEDVE